MNQIINKTIIQALKVKKLDESYIQILEFFKANPDSVLTHHYLGIRCELSKEYNLAIRHYRAALALDGTYRPVIENLYRLGQGKKAPILFGDEVN